MDESWARNEFSYPSFSCRGAYKLDLALLSIFKKSFYDYIYNGSKERLSYWEAVKLVALMIDLRAFLVLVAVETRFLIALLLPPILMVLVSLSLLFCELPLIKLQELLLL